MKDLLTLATNEITARHVFFVDWFTGRAEDTAMAECEASFAPDFRIIWPDGSAHDCAALVEMRRGAKGGHDANFAIRVEIDHHIDITKDDILVTFDEHQHLDGRDNHRRATALFTRDTTAPEGVLWRYLHQTWITA